MRSDAERLAPGPLISTHSAPITTPGMLEGLGDGGEKVLRRVVPFSMSAADARTFAMARIRCATGHACALVPELANAYILHLHAACVMVTTAWHGGMC